MNHMIQIAAISQLHLDIEGRAYDRRKRAAGNATGGERCLNRRISDAIGGGFAPVAHGCDPGCL